MTRLPGAIDSARPGCGSNSAHVVVGNDPRARDQEFRAEQVVDGLRGRDHVADRIGRRSCAWCARFPAADARAPDPAPVRIDRARGARRHNPSTISLATGTLTKSGSPLAAARSAKAIFSTSASRWIVSVVPKPMRADVVALEDVQHLRDVHAGGCRRRRTEDLPAAIARPIGARSTVLYQARSLWVMKPPFFSM